MKRLTILAGIFVLCCAPVGTRADDARISPAILNTIYHGTTAPAFGNPSGVKIVEFYDYQCGYCKAEEGDLERLLREDGRLEIIYMDFPKLGPLSLTAAKATLASTRQGMDKYRVYHDMLMNPKFSVSEDSLWQAAEAAGLDTGRLKQDMEDPAIAQQIQNNIALGKSAGVRVTPSFIIGGHAFFGFSQYDQLKQMVAYVRATGTAR